LDIQSGSLIDSWPDATNNVLILSGDAVFDSRLLQLLDAQNSMTALVDSAVPENLEPLISSTPMTSRGHFCGAALLSREWTSAHNGPFKEVLREGLETQSIDTLDVASIDWYSKETRRELRAYWFPAPDLKQRKLAEHVLLEAAQKGAQDLPALVHAPIETFLISHLCKTPITPNQLTIFTNIVAWTATLLFATGHLILGTAVALAIGVLDGLDGKQARVKVETTKLGKLEHFFDAIFENSWWVALAYHFQSSGQLPGAFRVLLLLLCAEAVGGIAKGAVKHYCGRSIDELSSFDRFVRLIGARRNIHIWILTVGLVLRGPAKAFVVIALWETITTTVQLFRTAWILLSRSRDPVRID
jgi:phosphatidylglycerophosphate synthase